MDISTGIIIAILIVLVYLVYVNLVKIDNKLQHGVKSDMQHGVQGDLQSSVTEGMSGAKSYDKLAGEALGENYEYFATCGSQGANDKVLDAICSGEDTSLSQKWDYTGKGGSYGDFVTSWAVDDKVVENHLKFVRDRKGLGPEGEFVTGRTYSPDSHDSYDPIPWIGIRGRPQYVKQCNPTQVPDVDTNLYKGNRPFCFWT